MIILKTSWGDDIRSPTAEQIHQTLRDFHNNSELFVILENSATDAFVQTAGETGSFIVEFWANGSMVAEHVVPNLENVRQHFDRFYADNRALLRKRKGTASFVATPEASYPLPDQRAFAKKSKKWLVWILVFIAAIGVGAGLYAGESVAVSLAVGGFLGGYFWVIFVIMPLLLIRFPKFCIEAVANAIGMPVTVVQYRRTLSLVLQPGVKNQIFKRIFLELLLIVLALLGILLGFAGLMLLVFSFARLLPA